MVMVLSFLEHVNIQNFLENKNIYIVEFDLEKNKTYNNRRDNILNNISYMNNQILNKNHDESYYHITDSSYILISDIDDISKIENILDTGHKHDTVIVIPIDKTKITYDIIKVISNLLEQ